MLKSSTVYCSDENVGTMQVSQEGLYYKFSGRFTLQCNKIWRIIASSPGRKIDLGICLYEAPYFTLKKKMPVKCFGDGDWSYSAVCPADISEGIFERLQDIEKGRLLNGPEGSAIVFDSN